MKRLLFLLLFCIFGNFFSYAQPLVGLDLTFANKGIYEGDSGMVIKMAVQQDGKIVIAGGEYKLARGQDVTAMRFNVDGSIDSSFAENGRFYCDVSKW